MTREHKQALRILFELGAPRRIRVDWPDYIQYGIGSENVEDLIQLLIDPVLHGAPTESNEVWAPLHAWRALGQLGDSRAIEPLIHAFDTLCDDDWAAEELPVVLGMLGERASTMRQAGRSGARRRISSDSFDMPACSAVVAWPTTLASCS